MSRSFMLFLALFALSSSLVACGPSRGSSRDDDDATEDDDDATADDDDATADDDDATADDDDATADDDDAVPTECPGGLNQIDEVEPNDGEDETLATMQDIGPQSEGFCVIGEAVCGNDGEDAFTGGMDFIVFQAGADADVDYGLAWGGSNTDMDGTVQEVETEAVLHEFEIGYGPESGSFSITEGNTYVLRVGCWEGTDGEWVAAFVF